MAVTKELSEDTRTKIIDLGMARKRDSTTQRGKQLGVTKSTVGGKCKKKGRHTRKWIVSLDLGGPRKISYRRVKLIKTAKTVGLYGRTWWLTLRELGPTQQRSPSVTHYADREPDSPPAEASTCPGPSKVCLWPCIKSKEGLGESQCHVSR